MSPHAELASGETGERVVTTIEVLSLTNKTPGLRGRTLYLQKQQEVLDSDVLIHGWKGAD